MLRIFTSEKSNGFGRVWTANLGARGQHANHYTTEAVWLTQSNDLCFTSLKRDLRSYDVIHHEFRDDRSCCTYSQVIIHFYAGNGESQLLQNVGNYQQA